MKILTILYLIFIQVSLAQDRDISRFDYKEIQTASRTGMRLDAKNPEFKKLEDSERDKYKIQLINKPSVGTVFTDTKGNLIHQDKKEFNILVLSLDNFLYSIPKIGGIIHHTSFGTQNYFAGRVLIRKGKLMGLSNSSGHFRPPPILLEKFINTLVKEKEINNPFWVEVNPYFLDDTLPIIDPRNNKRITTNNGFLCCEMMEIPPQSKQQLIDEILKKAPKNW